MDSIAEGTAIEERVRVVTQSLPPGSFLRNYVAYASKLTDCNSAYHIGCALAILTQTIPDDMHIRLGSRLWGNLYVLIVGQSTTSRKTAAVKIAREVLEEAIPGRVAEAPGSYEGLIDSLRAQPRQLVPYEEFGQFLAASERSYLTPIKTTLTNIYDGSPAGRKLVSSANKKVSPPVQKPRLSLLCACAPGYLSRHSEPVDWTDGFFARFLMMNAPRARYYELTQPEDRELRDWLVGRLRQLGGAQGVPGPCAGLTPQATFVWRRWEQERETFAENNSHSKVVGAIGRSPALALKIAMALAWEQGVIGENEWRISEEQLIPALKIVGIHIDGVLAIGDTIGGTIAMNDRQAVLSVITDQPKTFGQVIKESYLLRRRVLEILESLKEDGSISAVPYQMGPTAVEAYVRGKLPDPRPDAKVLQLFGPSSTPTGETVKPLFEPRFPGDVP